MTITETPPTLDKRPQREAPEIQSELATPEVEPAVSLEAVSSRLLARFGKAKRNGALIITKLAGEMPSNDGGKHARAHQSWVQRNIRKSGLSQPRPFEYSPMHRAETGDTATTYDPNHVPRHKPAKHLRALSDSELSSQSGQANDSAPTGGDHAVRQHRAEVPVDSPSLATTPPRHRADQ